MSELYKFVVKNKNGDVKMEEYRDKVLLIVNTATGCGFTPQYKELQELYLKFGNEKFEILDFPCNQFANQAPGSNEEISSFCELKYNTTFPLFSKIDVNGENEEPLYRYLKSSKKGVFGSNIKWNFTKFLVDKEGNVVERFAPMTKPSKISDVIENLLV